MRLINFKNDESFFSEQDRDLFGNIVGNSVDDLKKRIQQEELGHIEEIYSNKKFVHSKLNKMGLHVYRILLANRIRMFNPSPQVEALKKFDSLGVLYIDNFLSDREFNHVIEYFEDKVKKAFKDGGKGRVNGDIILGKTNPLNQLIKKCAHVNDYSSDAVDGFPRTEFWYHKHFGGDSQYKFHTDTFQPTVKSWLYLEDISNEHGPFSFIPTSNIIDEKRLKWDHMNALIAEAGSSHPLWNKRVERGGKPGSFRIHEGSRDHEEMQALNDVGYKDGYVLSGKKNTLVIANTYGFHKRGMAMPGTMRSTMTFQYRPQAFGLY